MKKYRRLAKLARYVDESYPEARRVGRRLVRKFAIQPVQAEDLIAHAFIALAVGPKKFTGCGIPGGGRKGRHFPARVSTRRVFLKAMESIAFNIMLWRHRHPHVAFIEDVEDMDFTRGRARGPAEEFHQRGMHWNEDGEFTPRRASPSAEAFLYGGGDDWRNGADSQW